MSGQDKSDLRKLIDKSDLGIWKLIDKSILIDSLIDSLSCF